MAFPNIYRLSRSVNSGEAICFSLIGCNSIWGKKKRVQLSRATRLNSQFTVAALGKLDPVLWPHCVPLDKWVVKELCHHGAFLNSPDPMIMCLLVKNRPVLENSAYVICLWKLNIHACLLKALKSPVIKTVYEIWLIKNFPILYEHKTFS